MKKLFPILLVGVLFVFSGCSECQKECCVKGESEVAGEADLDDCEDPYLSGVIISGFKGRVLDDFNSRTSKNWGAVFFDDLVDRNEDRCYLTGLDEEILYFSALNNWEKDTVKVEPQHFAKGNFLRIPGDGGANEDFFAFVDLDWTPTSPKNPQTDPNPPNDGENLPSALNNQNNKFTSGKVIIEDLPSSMNLSELALPEELKADFSIKNDTIPILLPLGYKNNKPWYEKLKGKKDDPADFSIVIFVGTDMSSGDKQLFMAAVHVDI